MGGVVLQALHYTYLTDGFLKLALEKKIIWWLPHGIIFILNCLMKIKIGFISA